MDADIIIVGGGCAGLSLATRLADAGCNAPRTMVVEPRTSYENDRTWSGWRVREHRFLDCVRASWSRWEISHAGRHVIRGDARLPYDTIPADLFYAAGQSAISRNDRISLHTGTRACAIGESADAAWVDTDQGRLAAALVIDTRPPPTIIKGGLLQAFAGLEVETERPCFDPATVGLMAFEAASPGCITFLYTLPFSPTRALLEWTHMSPVACAPPEFDAVALLLRDRLGCDFTVIRTESGCLPMQPAGQPGAAPRRVLALGTPAGALRASTGYGFANIQAQSEALAGVLRGGPAAALGWRAAPPPAWMRCMDKLFLRVLRHHPETGPGILTTLFRRCPSAPLVRFLSGTGGLIDGGRVALSMPKAPFVRELAWLN